MRKPTEQDIAARAYRLWEEAGMPEGKGVLACCGAAAIERGQVKSDAEARHTVSKS